MKNRQGFVLIETIITVVFLTTTLLYLYNSYSSIINNEERRLYYDDIAYIYKTNQIRTFLEDNSNIERIKNYAFSNSYIVTIGPAFDNMFTVVQEEANMNVSLENIFNNFNINQMIIMDTQMLDDCDNTSNDSEKCNTSTESLSYEFSTYIRSLSDTSYDYLLIIEYAETISDGKIAKCSPGIDNNCRSYYASLGI